MPSLFIARQVGSSRKIQVKPSIFSHKQIAMAQKSLKTNTSSKCFPFLSIFPWFFYTILLIFSFFPWFFGHWGKPQAVGARALSSAAPRLRSGALVGALVGDLVDGREGGEARHHEQRLGDLETWKGADGWG